MNTVKQFRAIDFFCGAGGMTYGMSLAGVHVIAGIDIDNDCQETYELNNPGSKFLLADIKKLTTNKLIEESQIRKDDDKLIFIACSPCQYWTQLRTDKTKSSKTKNLLFYFKEFVEYFMPGYIVMENVPGILKNRKESGLDNFIGFLEKNGYALAYDILNTVDYGVPQTRKRFVLVASRVDDVVFIPQKTINKIPTVKDFIGTDNGFPVLSPRCIDNRKSMHTTAGLSEKNIERLESTPHDGGTRHSWKNIPHLQLKTYIGKDDTFPDTYGRLYWSRPAPTITTKFYSITNGRFAHPEENRGLSLREGATLQTFPRSYIFKGDSMATIARQIGNAVPPKFAKAVINFLIG